MIATTKSMTRLALIVATVSITLAVSEAYGGAKTPKQPGLADNISDAYDYCFLVNGKMTQDKSQPGITAHTCTFADGARSITVSEVHAIKRGKILGKLTSDRVSTYAQYQDLLRVSRNARGVVESTCYESGAECHSFKRVVRGRRSKITIIAKVIWWTSKGGGVVQMMTVADDTKYSGK